MFGKYKTSNFEDDFYCALNMNMLDYLEWRGDLPFERDPFNEVDALILSLISYYEFEQFYQVATDVRGYTLAEYVNLHEDNVQIFGEIDKNIDIENDIVPRKTAPFVLCKAVKTERFANIRIVDFRNIFDEERVIQFAAVTFELSDGIRVVAYRGTDSSIIGWKEDCMLSYLREIPGQAEAVRYFNEADSGKKYYIVGHSKGGNEALYTYVKMKEERVGDVLAVYNFDGPGFLDKIQDTPRYLEGKEKIHTFVPSSSIVGMLLEHVKDYIAVKSQGYGIKQHNPLFWEVCRANLVTEVDNVWVRDVAEHTFSEFLKEMTNEERKFVTENVFSIVSSCGAKSFAELYEHPFRNTKIIVATYSKLPDEHKDKLIKASKLLGFSWASSYRFGLGEVKPTDKQPLLKPFFSLGKKK